jgi:hypothetical protein
MVRATVAVSLAVPADAVVSATDVVPATGVGIYSPLEGVACELTIPQFLGLSASTRRISPSRRAARLPTGDLDDASPTQPPKWVLAQIGQKKPAPPNRRHRRGCGWQTRYRETLPSRTTNARKSERPAKLARSEPYRGTGLPDYRKPAVKRALELPVLEDRTRPRGERGRSRAGRRDATGRSPTRSRSSI